MSDWTQLIDTGFQKLGELAGKYGPPAIDTAASVIHADAIGDLVRGAVCLAVGTGIAVGGLRLLAFGCERRAKEAAAIATQNEGKQYPYTRTVESDFALHQILPGIVVATIGGIFLIATIYGLTDQWMWVALWNPKLALAAKVVHALPGMGQ